jgi:trigger factor
MEKKVEVLNSDSCQTTFGVELPEKEVKRVTEETYHSLQLRVSIPGFRRGRAPLEIVQKQFVSQAREEVIEQLISYSVSEIIKEKNLKPIVSPRVSNLKFQFGKPFNFNLVIESRPQFEPKEYKKIILEKKIKKITEKDIEKVVISLQERNAYLVESNEEIVKKEHHLLVDYEIFLDENSVPLESLKNQLFDLSQPDLIPGLKEQLVNAKKGELKEIKITFPGDYPKKELAGKEAILKIKINALKEKKLSPVNDDFARDLNFSSLEEMKLKIKENLEKFEEERAQKEIKNQISEYLLKNNSLPLPPSLVEKELESILGEMYKFYQTQNLTDLWEKNLPQLKEKYRPEAEKRVHLSLLLLGIAEKEKIEPQEEKIFDFLIKNAKIKEMEVKNAQCNYL